MPEYLSPGVYVEEVDTGSKPIEGVGTSTAGFLGTTERGPTTPQLITNWSQFVNTYGGFGANHYLPHSIYGFLNNGGVRCFVTRIVAKDSRVAESMLPAQRDPKSRELVKLSVRASGPGAWGNNIVIQVDPDPDRPANFRITVGYWKNGVPPAIKPAAALPAASTPAPAPQPPAGDKGKKGETPEAAAGGESKESTSLSATEPAGKTAVAVAEEKPISQNEELSALEVFETLVADPTATNYFIRKVNSASKLITLAEDGPITMPIQNGRYYFNGGVDGRLSPMDYVGENLGPGKRTGLQSFTAVDEIAIVAAPGVTDEAVRTELLAHCQNMRYRVAVLDCNPNLSPLAAKEERQKMDSKYAAYYYPWIKVADPATGSPVVVPPSGHVAGVFARTDATVGVHKAPANEIIQGAIGLEFDLTKGEQDILNPLGINCLRAFPGRGIRIWGARTISSDASWRYLNVRRLFNFVENSIDLGTQWVVFEPNNALLWGRIRRNITAFLTRVWRDGALVGATPAEAFFVKCDAETNPPEVVDAGQVVIQIGLAPVKPAEFVIFRIGQWAGGGAAAE